MDKDMIIADPITELGESLKLTKNSKGYTWEIRLRCKDKEQIDEAFINRMQKTNNEMLKRFDNSTGYEDPEPLTPKKFSASFKDEFKE